MIFLVVALHNTLQIIVMLVEMGRVHKVSGQFTEEWMRHLVKKINYLDFNNCADTKKNEHDLTYEDLDYVNLEAYQNYALGDVRTRRWTGFVLKSLLETCKPFGFECGGCYVVTPNTVLTFFSILTSYLIIILQLQV